MPTETALGVTQVRAVERAVELMFLLAERPRSVSLQQLADEIGCSKSTVYRLLATLERLEVVEHDPALRQYRVGRRLRELAQDEPTRLDLRALAAPHLPALRDLSGETATFHVRDGAVHIIAAQCESTQEIRRVLPVGQRVPLLKGATAKAILAFLPPDEAAAILAQTRKADDPGPTVEELADIRDVGYSFSYSERVPGGSAMSAPILDGAGSVCGALSIAGPSFRFTPARATRCAPGLLDAAAQVSAALRTASPAGV